MVLTVPFEEFPAAVKKLGAQDVFLSEQGKHTLVTAADPRKGLIISSTAEKPIKAIEALLEAEGCRALRGRWADAVPESGESSGRSGAYIAAVAYQSREAMPGLWMDAFATQPTQQIVLRTMFDEFRSNDEIGEISYEDFLKGIKPNVVILSPGEIETFLSHKGDC